MNRHLRQEIGDLLYLTFENEAPPKQIVHPYAHLVSDPRFLHDTADCNFITTSSRKTSTISSACHNTTPAFTKQSNLPAGPARKAQTAMMLIGIGVIM